VRQNRYKNFYCHWARTVRLTNWSK